MKNFIRKLTALILAMVILTTFAACKSNEKPEETPQSQTEIPLTEAETQTEIEKPQNLIASDSDFDALLDLLNSLSFNPGYTFEYSSDSPDAYKTVMSEIIPVWGGEFPIYEYIYGESATNTSLVREHDEQSDPLNKFPSSYYYEKVSAEKIDWILENIFNIHPNHDGFELTGYPWDNDGPCRAYYYDGYYYFTQGDGGSAGFLLEIITFDKLDNNIYSVCYNSYNEDGLAATYKVKCALKDTDHGTFWTLYSIERVKTYSQYSSYN